MTVSLPPISSIPGHRSGPLWEKSVELEASFLSEMLSHTGLDDASAFGGGEAEGQFSSFLREQQARKMAEHGGIGLAEHLFHALSERAGNAG